MFLKWRTGNSKTWDLAELLLPQLWGRALSSPSVLPYLLLLGGIWVLEGSSNIVSQVGLFCSLMCFFFLSFFPSIHHWTGSCSRLVQIKHARIWSAGKLPEKHMKTVLFWATHKSEAALEAVRAVPLQRAALSLSLPLYEPGAGALAPAAVRAGRYAATWGERSVGWGSTAGHAVPCAGRRASGRSPQSLPFRGLPAASGASAAERGVRPPGTAARR